MKQYGFFVDSTKCTGCKTCQISCKDEKNLELGPKLRRVYEYGGGSWTQQGNLWVQNVFNYYLSIACNHCSSPTCVTGCPTAPCTNVKKTAWWWSIRISVLVAATAKCAAPMARRNLMPKRS